MAEPSLRADVVVVGAGHAGCEAALAAVRLGREVCLVTLDLDHVARLSCNPAVGGLGKGHLVREIDALGGVMGRVTDRACIQFRRLNTRRGLAVRSSRAQVDIELYPAFMLEALRAEPRLHLVESEVVELLAGESGVRGVRLADGCAILAPRVILTTGTFLSALLHCGPETRPGGRWGEAAAGRLSASLRALGLRLARLKTGTTPRLDEATIDWSKLARQEDTFPKGRFSFDPRPGASRPPQRDCFMAWTHPGAHELIRKSLDRAPLFTGQIQGRGPRYCPSIEDKIVRFPERERHLLFLEPEGLSTPRVYVNGLSTSLPRDVQEDLVHALPGLERARLLQHGYAVEYDFADPRDLGPGLEHRGLPGLHLAGQVNGTSGYEEAAAQGLVAGVSAALGEPLRLARHEAYIGVMIDDLTSRGVGGEPYRMFTSRAEFRLSLREDNADRRLTPRGRALGLVDDEAWARFERKMDAIGRARHLVEEDRWLPDEANAARVAAAGLGTLDHPATLAELLRRPEADWSKISLLRPDLASVPPDCAEQVETDLKYAGYISREAMRAREAECLAAIPLPEDLLRADLAGLSIEVRQRLREAMPPDLDAASRVPGVTPAALQLLAVHLARRAGREGGKA
jgi:tRNA uridine 5-carboxymethylaminomethyl modification enzyme